MRGMRADWVKIYNSHSRTYCHYFSYFDVSEGAGFHLGSIAGRCGIMNEASRIQMILAQTGSVERSNDCIWA